MVAHPSLLVAIEAPRNRWGNLGWHDEVGPELLDGNPPKVPRMGTLSGIGTPPFCRPFVTATSWPRTRGTGTGEPLRAPREEETIHRLRSPFWEGHGGVFGGPVGVRDLRETPRAAVSRSCQRFTALWRPHSSRRGCRTEVRGTSSRCGAASLKNRWRGMFRRAKRRCSSASVSKPPR